MALGESTQTSLEQFLSSISFSILLSSHNLSPLEAQSRASQVALMVKNPPANEGEIRDTDSIPGSRRSLERGMATQSSVLAWRIPGMGHPGGLPSMGSHRVILLK